MIISQDNVTFLNWNEDSESAKEKISNMAVNDENAKSLNILCVEFSGTNEILKSIGDVSFLTPEENAHNFYSAKISAFLETVTTPVFLDEAAKLGLKLTFAELKKKKLKFDVIFLPVCDERQLKKIDTLKLILEIENLMVDFNMNSEIWVEKPEETSVYALSMDSDFTEDDDKPKSKKKKKKNKKKKGSK